MKSAIKLSEAEVKLKVKETGPTGVKRAVEEYLQYQMNLGKLWFTRLNTGEFLVGDGEKKRLIKGAKKGTLDFIVIQVPKNIVSSAIQLKVIPTYADPIPVAVFLSIVTFIECKSTDGKTTPEQDEFADRVRALNCRCITVRSVDEVMEVLGR